MVRTCRSGKSERARAAAGRQQHLSPAPTRRRAAPNERAEPRARHKATRRHQQALIRAPPGRPGPLRRAAADAGKRSGEAARHQLPAGERVRATAPGDARREPTPDRTMAAMEIDTPASALGEAAPTSGEVTGVIRPPPDIRVIVDKTALFVARNGKQFESRIQQSAEGQSQKFAFMRPSDPCAPRVSNCVAAVSRRLRGRAPATRRRRGSSRGPNSGRPWTGRGTAAGCHVDIPRGRVAARGRPRPTRLFERKRRSHAGEATPWQPRGVAAPCGPGRRVLERHRTGGRHLHGSWYPRRRHDTSTECPRGTRGGAATGLHGIST